MNRLTDMDWGWWPFLFLRPHRDEKMTSVLVIKIAVCFSLFYGAPLYLLLRLPNWGFDFFEAGAFMLFVAVSFFAIYRLTFAYCWNKRAARLHLHGWLNQS